MTIIKISSIGGIFPSTKGRALPDGANTVAANIYPSYPDFRPLPQDANVATSAVNAPQTLYRFARKADGTLNDDLTTGWRAHASHINIVKAALNDDLSERTYYTYADGSAPPRAHDVNAEDRLMGIPAPTEAPTLTLSPVEEFTPDDKAQGVEQIRVLALEHVTDSLSTVWRGMDHPGSSVAGLFDRDSTYTSSEYGAEALRVFRLTSTGGSNLGPVTDTYSSLAEAAANWVISPDLSPIYITANGTHPGWTGNTHDHIAIPLAAYGKTYDCDTSSLATALAAIDMPGMTDGTKFFTSLQATAIANTVAAKLNPTGPTLAPKIAALRAKVAETLALFQGGSQSVTQGTVASFYTTVANSQITTAVANLADEIYTKAELIATARGATDETENTGRTDTSLIYKDGDKATAVAAIIAYVTGQISTLDDGSRSLNVQAVQSWIRAEGVVLLGEYVWSYDASLQQFNRTETYSNVKRLADFIAKGNWQAHPQFPGNGTVAGDAAAVRAAQAQLRTLSAAITAESERIIANFDADLIAYYDSEDIESQLPPLVVRIPEDRYYVFTYVDDWGQESAPSPISAVIECDQNDGVTINFPTPPSGRDIVGFRLYRSSAGTESATFRLVPTTDTYYAELDDLGQFDYYKISIEEGTDSIKASGLGEPCPSFGWAEPPSNLQGLVGMPNGTLAGFFGNTVCFSESFVQYAWPDEYQITCEYPIVGLGVFGQTLVVTHHGGVDYISGADAASMSQTHGVSTQVCVSAKSIVNIERGVLFASPDGMCLASAAGIQIITERHFNLPEWRSLVPSTMLAAYYEQIVFMLMSGTAYLLHIPSGKMITIAIDDTVSALFVDRVTDALYYVTGTTIRRAFAGVGNRTGYAYSKVFIFPRQEPLAWLQVEADDAFGQVIVRWFGDGVLRHTATVTSNTPVRLPAGRYREHTVEIESSMNVSTVTLASTTAELQSV